MANNYLPLSGAVTQAFEAWVSLFSAFGSQFGLINVNVGASSNPNTEREIVSRTASYGKQLGRIGDAIAVLLKHLPTELELAPEEQRAITDLKAMLTTCAKVKERDGAKHVVWPPP